jgi:hypothetical protein
VLNLYCKATGMEIKFDKYCLNSHFLFGSLKQQIGELLHFPRKEIEIGFNYLRFVLKHNNYKFVYWMWIYKKVEARITIWVNKLLLRGGGGGRSVLLKSVLESI